MPEVYANEVADAEVVAEEALSAREKARRWLLSALLHRRVSLPTEAEPQSENWLAEESPVESRMPARMALAVLAGEGLIRQRARHGFWMVEYDAEDIAQIARMRADVEATVVEALCNDGGPRDVEAWKRVLEAISKMERLIEEDGLAADFGDLETSFHVDLALTGDLQIAARHIEEMSNQIRIFELQNALETQPSEEAVARHRELLTAIMEGDQSEAVDIVRRDVVSLRPPIEEPEQDDQDEVPIRSFAVHAAELAQSVGRFEVAGH